jgi:hypothetical protein
MNIFLFVYMFILFVLLTPGTLINLSIGGKSAYSKWMVAAIHASTQHYGAYSANQLFDDALHHPFTNITPLNESSDG